MGAVSTDPSRIARAAIAVGALLFAFGSAFPDGTRAPTADRQRARLAETSRQLRGEVERLRGRERGVLGELNTLDAEILLERHEIERLSFESDGLEARADAIQRERAALTAESERLREYLTRRLRALYVQGDGRDLKRLVLDPGAESFLEGWRAAGAASRRDADRLTEWRRTVREAEARTRELQGTRASLEAALTEREGSRARLEAARRRRAGVLDSLRRDRLAREAALEEIAAAARAIDALAAAGEPVIPPRAIGKFRGLLERPAEGAVSARFGERVHPRFKTVLPHPGWDLDAAEGDPFHAVFDGTVRFASWLEGYGLTAIVDHGEGVLSIYAHASVLEVQKGDRVLAGDALGRVGATGSLRGAYLYFEIRENGRAVDPATWLRDG